MALMPLVNRVRFFHHPSPVTRHLSLVTLHSSLFITFAKQKNTMHPRTFLTGTLLLLTTLAHGQSKLERNVLKDIQVFGGLGTTLYFGDVGGKDSKIVGPRALFDNLDIDLWQARPMCTFGVRINPMRLSAFALQFSPMFLSGNDLRSNYAPRGYAFKTRLFEMSLDWQYYFAGHITGVAPFATVGLAGMFYSFKNNISEARSRWYSGNSLILGIGTRLPSKTRFVQSIDGAFHFTTTDFLDGFKTAKKSNDLFFVLTYKIYFQIYTSWYYDHRGLVR